MSLASIDWVAWYLETLDALEATLEAANVEWATDYAGDPHIYLGDRAGTGLEFPCAFVPQLTSDRDASESTRDTELQRLTGVILVLTQGDAKRQEANLREAATLMGQTLNSLYRDRSLGGTVEALHVTQATPMAVPTDSAALAGAHIEFEVTKEAVIY